MTLCCLLCDKYICKDFLAIVWHRLLFADSENYYTIGLLGKYYFYLTIEGQCPSKVKQIEAILHSFIGFCYQ